MLQPVTTMLLRNSIGLLHKIDATVGRCCRSFSVITNKWCSGHVSSPQLLWGPRVWTPYRCAQWLVSYSTDGSSSSDSDTYDELCVYQPDVRRVRIVTMNDVETDELDVAQSQSSVQHDTIYTRHHVASDDPAVKSLFQGICEGSRSALARAITLVESVHPRRRAEAQVLLREVLEYSRKKRQHSLHRVNSFRIGLSGPPGAGKSTHIEALGKLLTNLGHKVAVLAVDPSSSNTGGSLLGDKTRMPQLSCDPNAYIRPSPSAGNLGGVTRVTHDAIVLCEGAGYDIILVETVGVGQSEFVVADMVDMFELLIPPAGGDELQGIKKGIVEVADIIVINKSDGDLVPAARHIQMEYTSALKFVRPKTQQWRPQVMRVSSTTGEGLSDLWEKMKEFRNKLTLSGDLERRREKQYVRWMDSHIADKLRLLFLEHPTVCRLMPKLEFLVEKGAVTPGYAADILLQQFSSSLRLTGNIPMSDVAQELLKAEKQLNEVLSNEQT